ncbi:MAG: hypothetical protein ACI4DY_15005 [Monoglobaceae bacterium]
MKTVLSRVKLNTKHIVWLLIFMLAAAGLVFSSATGGEVSSILNTAIPILLISSGIIILFVARYSATMRKKIDRINKLFLETLFSIGKADGKARGSDGTAKSG